MNLRYAAVALSTLAVMAFGATEASAMVKDPEPGFMGSTIPLTPSDWPDEGAGYPGFEGTAEYDHPYNYSNYDPAYAVPAVRAATPQPTIDHDRPQVLQAGASALGGAGVAAGAMWLHRRRGARAA
jgi:hypothetical protein